MTEATPDQLMSTDPTPTTRPETTQNRTAGATPRRAGAPTTSPRSDPWASGETEAFTARNAPRTFDPFCTDRLRNLADEENAATPDGGAR